MSLFSIRRQMDDLMNQMMLHHSTSLFDNDPFFSDQLMLEDNTNTNNNKNIDKNKSKNEAQQHSTSLTANNNNNTSLSTMSNKQWGMMKCDVHEEKDKFIVSAELPGVSKDQVKVNVENGYLTISGNKKEESNDVKNDNGREVRRSERRYGEFRRSFRLPETADFNNINAKFDNGVLSLNIPKLEKIPSKQQQITIN